jgi:signal peptidase I
MRKRFLRAAMRFAGSLGLSVGLSFLLFHVVWQPFQVCGSSMAPTLAPGDYLLVDRTWSFRSEPRRGDLVVFRHPNASAFVVKRVVGLEGDVVEWRGGDLAVNGRPFQRPPGARHQEDGVYETWVVPPSTVFCLGDNLPTSEDSRSFGPIDRDRLYGRVLLCYLPPGHWKWLLPDSPKPQPPSPTRSQP